MKIEEAELGRAVVYTPFVGCDPKLKEEGIITNKNSRFVFVRYGSDYHSKGTDAEDLEYICL